MLNISKSWLIILKIFIYKIIIRDIMVYYYLFYFKNNDRGYNDLLIIDFKRFILFKNFSKK